MRTNNFWMIVASPASFPRFYATGVWGRKRGYLFAFLIFCFDLYLLMMSGYHQAAINRAIGKKWNLIVRQ